MNLPLSNEYLVWFVKVAGILFVILTVAAYMVWAERRVSAWMQDRIGPNLVGPFGLLQPLADVIKLAFKEDITPFVADKLLHFIAPGLIMTAPVLAVSVIPFAPGLWIANPDFGLLWLLGATSIAAYGVILGGIAGGSKYPLLGSLRSMSQIVSYELPMGISALGPAVMAGSLSLVDIVEAQKNLWFIVPQFIGFLVFLITTYAETNRLPFDLPEAEAELTGGYHTEFSSLKFAWFFAGEYANMVIASSSVSILFLGGWYGPFAPGLHWTILKISFFLFLFL
ncbi:MAG: complex I subunit 1 family protein, partial [candidate division WOR-3 bacterium]